MNWGDLKDHANQVIDNNIYGDTLPRIRKLSQANIKKGTPEYANSFDKQIDEDLQILCTDPKEIGKKEELKLFGQTEFILHKNDMIYHDVLPDKKQECVKFFISDQESIIELTITLDNT